MARLHGMSGTSFSLVVAGSSDLVSAASSNVPFWISAARNRFRRKAQIVLRGLVLRQVRDDKDIRVLLE